MELHALIMATTRPNPPAKVAKLNLGRPLRDQVAAGLAVADQAQEAGLSLEGLRIELGATMALTYDDPDAINDIAAADGSGVLDHGVIKAGSDARVIGVIREDGLADLDERPAPEPDDWLTLRLFSDSDGSGRIWAQVEGTIDGDLAQSAPFTAASLKALCDEALGAA